LLNKFMEIESAGETEDFDSFGSESGPERPSSRDRKFFESIEDYFREQDDL